MPIISVIVPVYNVEKYLLQCVDAILAQTFTDFELILVDDGSTDNSSVLCNAYAEKDKRVRVLHKENGGQAEARNLGIDIARGQYLTFIDSDDLVSPEYLDRLLNAIQETNAEIAACGEISFQDGEPVSFDSEAACGYDRMSGREICVSHYQTKWPMPVAPWGKLYKATLFKEIRFPTGKIYEDQGTVPRLWYLAEKIAMIRGGAFYAYRIRKGSTSHSAFSRRMFEDVWNVELCRTFFAEKNDPEMEALCVRFRDILQAKYIVLAHHNNAVDQIPDEYKMCLGKALRLLRREIRDYTYTWYLSLVHPTWVKQHSYIRKIEELLGIAKTER